MKPSLLPDIAEDVLLYDLSILQEMGQQDASFVTDMIRSAIKQVPITLHELNLACTHHDRNVIRPLAHRMRSFIDTLGIHSLQQVASRLEGLARDEKWSLIDACLAEINQVIPRAMIQLKAFA